MTHLDHPESSTLNLEAVHLEGFHLASIQTISHLESNFSFDSCRLKLQILLLRWVLEYLNLDGTIQLTQTFDGDFQNRLIYALII